MFFFFGKWYLNWRIFIFLTKKIGQCSPVKVWSNLKFWTEKLKNAYRKLLNLRNIHSVFIPNMAIFILERNLIGTDFDHML